MNGKLLVMKREERVGIIPDYVPGFDSPVFYLDSMKVGYAKRKKIVTATEKRAVKEDAYREFKNGRERERRR